MLALLSSPFLSFASLPSCPDDSISDPPIPGVLQGKGSGQGHVLLAMVRYAGRRMRPMHSHLLTFAQRAPAPQAPDYSPYTKWTATVPKDLGGFNVEIGHALEAVCGVKVEFILDSWSSCFTVKPDRIYFRRGAPHTLSSLTTTRPHLSLSPLSRLARVQRGERVRWPRHHGRPLSRLHRVHAHQGGARPLARVH